MSELLLDTNVISEFVRRDSKPEPRVKKWLETIDPESLYALQSGRLQVIGPRRTRSSCANVFIA